ncbi:MAG: hypothetical protein Q8J97_10785, partial [Flavobacteriaceae bacterium]|nr:hypothetical protein [Flavobacteriaceae bacterium]
IIAVVKSDINNQKERHFASLFQNLICSSTSLIFSSRFVLISSITAGTTGALKVLSSFFSINKMRLWKHFSKSSFDQFMFKL